jgi:hypothetical protein
MGTSDHRKCRFKYCRSRMPDGGPQYCRSRMPEGGPQRADDGVVEASELPAQDPRRSSGVSALVLLCFIHLFRVQDQNGFHRDQTPDKGACGRTVPCSASRVMSGAGGTGRPPARRVQVWSTGSALWSAQRYLRG